MSTKTVVYVVMAGHYDHYEVVGVYASEAEAEKRRHGLFELQQNAEEHYRVGSWVNVEEVEYFGL
jgi:4-hydroxy-3-methylbut-2-enyl diphosphate reductase IspH